MLGAADAAGISLGGGGYRDPGRQIALREQNCGSSYYAIYQMPSSQCSPPTARPGSSQHELGLAIERLQSEVTELTDWRKKVAQNQKQILIGAAIAGFVIGGGIAGVTGLFRRR